MKQIIVIFPLILFLVGFVQGLSRRCYICRSRGVMGDCKDPFAFNETTVASTGIRAAPCPSGWCAKYIEGITGPPDEFGTATQRECMVFPPTDGEERCAIIPKNSKKTYACFCQGDLCNSAVTLSKFHQLFSPFVIIPFVVLILA